jgi:hypothetical protein
MTWVVISVTFLIFLAAAYFVSWEMIVYGTRSLPKAEQSAGSTFKRVCVEKNLDPKSFFGPKRIEVKNVTFAFLWTMRSDSRKTVEVDISYMPYDVQYYLSGALSAQSMEQHKSKMK